MAAPGQPGEHRDRRINGSDISGRVECGSREPGRPTANARAMVSITSTRVTSAVRSLTPTHIVPRAAEQVPRFDGEAEACERHDFKDQPDPRQDGTSEARVTLPPENARNSNIPTAKPTPASSATAHERVVHPMTPQNAPAVLVPRSTRPNASDTAMTAIVPTTVTPNAS